MPPPAAFADKMSRERSMPTRRCRYAAGSVISSQGRRVMIICGIVAAMLPAFVGLFQDTFSPLIGICIGGIGIALTAFAVSPTRAYYSPMVFSVWFNLGCVLAFGDLLINEAAHRAHPNPATGAFAYTDGEMWRAIACLGVGVIGIVVATVLSERWISKEVPSQPRMLRDKGVVVRAVLGWTVVGVSIALLLMYFQIGRTGLVNRTELPYHLGGLLSFARGYLIPAIGVLIVDLIVNGKQGWALKYMFAALLLVGFLGSVSALSRAYLGFLIIALALYLVVNLGRHRFGVRSLALWIAGGAPLLLIGIFLVNTLRESGFAGHELNLSSTYDFIVQSRMTDVGLILSDFFNLAVGRIGGLHELLGALSAPHAWELSNPWRIFLDDGVTALWLQKTVLGLVMHVDETVGFGYSFGLIGTLSLSGSLLIVFVGTAIYLMALMALEEFFFRIGASAVALSLAVNIGFQCWGFANITVSSNLIGIVVVTWLVTRFFFEMSGLVRAVPKLSAKAP